VNLSKERLRQVAEETKFRPDMLEKVIRLLSLLDGIRSHPFLKDRFALKGGTALNLFLFDIPRLSVDIDLNYVASPKREVMLAEKPKFQEAIRAVCERDGFTIRRMPEDHAGGKWMLRYESTAGGNANLEVDLNFMLRIPLWEPIPMDSKSVGVYQAKNIPVLDPHEIAAGKLAALLARHAGRDLFDAHLLLSQGNLDATRLRLAFVVYGAMNRRDWRTVTPDDVFFDKDELEVQLRPVLREGFISAPGDVWGQELVEKCRHALCVVLPLNPPEKEFLDRLLDHGEIKPDILTTDSAMAQRIAQHPMLEWKAHNVRQHRLKTRSNTSPHEF
jgi:predicted nucleotidyltransferase component of viral defense system